MPSLTELAPALVEIGQRMDRHGWVAGSAGNLSARLDETSVAITRSGVHKARLQTSDIIEVGLNGLAVNTNARPSAETLLHCQLYRLFPEVGAVLHGHSVAATVLSMAGGREIVFSDYEVLKAFGYATHEADAALPVFENDQDIARLAGVVEPYLATEVPLGYVIRGHGAYAWGSNVEHAYWRLEALEFLLTCELERRRMK